MRIFSLFSLLSVVACTGDKNPLHQAPEVTIESHQVDAEIVVGYPELLVANVVDYDHDLEQLTVEWSLDGEPQCPESDFESNGRHTCELVVSVDSSTITVMVTDPDGNSSQASITVVPVQTIAPSVALIQPLADGVYFANVVLDLAAEVEDERDSIEDLNIVWESSLDGILDVGLMFDSPTELFAGAMLSAGQHTLSIQVEDRSGSTAEDSVEIMVFEDNQAPNCEIILGV